MNRRRSQEQEGDTSGACEHQCVLDAYVIQMPLSWNPGDNASTILTALEQVASGSLVVTPEGSISGYPIDGDFTALEGATRRPRQRS